MSETRWQAVNYRNQKQKKSRTAVAVPDFRVCVPQIIKANMPL